MGKARKQSQMGSSKGHIVMLGQRSPLLEGVSDLLQLVGYQVELAPDWGRGDGTGRSSPPNLVIVDLSETMSETKSLPAQIRSVPHWASVPLLFVGFSGAKEIDDLLVRNHDPGSEGTHFYVHSTLSVEGLIQKVQSCLS